MIGSHGNTATISTPTWGSSSSHFTRQPQSGGKYSGYSDLTPRQHAAALVRRTGPQLRPGDYRRHDFDPSGHAAADAAAAAQLAEDGRAGPQLEELKKKYGNDRNKFAQAQMELYRENKINMFGGCLPLILQLVVMIAFYQALTGSLATNPLQLQTLSHRVLPVFVPLIPINPVFMIYDLGLHGILPTIEQNVSPIVAQLLVFILPALVVGTTYLSQKLMAAPSADPSQASTKGGLPMTLPHAKSHH